MTDRRPHAAHLTRRSATIGSAALTLAMIAAMGRPAAVATDSVSIDTQAATAAAASAPRVVVVVRRHHQAPVERATEYIPGPVQRVTVPSAPAPAPASQSGGS